MPRSNRPYAGAYARARRAATVALSTLSMLSALATLGTALPRVVTAQRPTIPTPESVFGFPIGKDSNLVDYEQSIDYFKKLAAASNGPICPSRPVLTAASTGVAGGDFPTALISCSRGDVRRCISP